MNKTVTGGWHACIKLRLCILASLATTAFLLIVPSSFAADTYVTLTFDDSRASQVNAGAILEAHGVHATFFVNSSQLGTSGYYMSIGGVQGLHAAGNEIGGHSLNHLHLPNVSQSTMESEICGDQQQLESWGFFPVSFAYPYGESSSAVEEVVSSCKERGYSVSSDYLSARGIGGVQFGYSSQAESVPPQNAYDLRTPGGSPTSSTSLEDLKTMVVNAESTGGWLVIPFHSVCAAPASAPYPGNAPDCADSYSITYDNLDQFVIWLNARSASGTSIKTVREVMTAPTPPPPEPGGPNLVHNDKLAGAEAKGVDTGQWSKYLPGAPANQS